MSSTVVLNSGLTGLVSFAILHNSPARGDVALLVEIAGALLVWATLRTVPSVHHVVAESALRTPASFTAVCAAIQLSVLAMATILYRLSPWHPLAKFPGPISYRISSLRSAQVVASGVRHKTVDALHKRYGKFVRLGPNALSINSGAAIGPIYAAAQCLDRSSLYSMHMLPGTGLFFAQTKEAHNPRRARWAQAFTSANLDAKHAGLERRTVQLTDCMLSSKDEEGSCDLSRCIEGWSYDVMGDFVFGDTSGLELMRDGDSLDWVKTGKEAMCAFEVLSEVPWLFDLLWHLPQTQTLRVLHDASRKLVVHRASAGNTDDTDLSSYLHATDDYGEPNLTEDEKTMDTFFALQAGSDTSANVLLYAFLLLMIHRDVYKKLQKELDETFPDPEDPLSVDVLAELPYLNAVINESLRLGVPFSGFWRAVPKEGMVIEGEYIAGGNIVSIPAWAQQTDPENFWPRPEEFIPERWLPGGLGPGSKLELNGLMAFSFGPFGCLGRVLAMQQLRVVIARVLLEFHMDSPKGFDAIAYLNGIRNMRTTLFPSPLRARLTKRRL